VVKAATDLSVRARRHVACRLLPFVFLLYLIQIIDRLNISFAALRMKSELGFSDSVYGFGVSLFSLTYFALEIPGVILVERWSARKWISGIVVAWGLITLLTALIQRLTSFTLFVCFWEPPRPVFSPELSSTSPTGSR
jgi:MFS transporter, ACS family, tartrate transporter